jgi:hypothetical protein
LVAFVAVNVAWVLVVVGMRVTRGPNQDEPLADYAGEFEDNCLPTVGNSPSAHRYCDCFYQGLKARGTTVGDMVELEKTLLTTGPTGAPEYHDIYMECAREWDEKSYPSSVRDALKLMCSNEVGDSPATDQVCDCFVEGLEGRFTLFELSQEGWKVTQDPSYVWTGLEAELEACMVHWNVPQYPAYVRTNSLNACSQNAPRTKCECVLTEVEARLGVVAYLQLDAELAANPGGELPPPLKEALAACTP